MGAKKEEPDRRNWFDKTAALMEKNIFGVKLGIYSVALTGLGLALRSVRPFAKFVHPSDIPKHFYEKHMKLNGKVVGISPGENGPLLLLDHRPILLSKFRQEKTLPVKIEGVNITGNGLSWLQTIVKGEQVNFILLKPSEKCVSCIVQHGKNDIASQLVSLGFASVSPYEMKLDKSKIYSKFYQNLLKEETKAERKRLGMWAESRKTLNQIFDYFLTTNKKPKMVPN